MSKIIENLIKKLEKERGSKVIVYITGDKQPNFHTQIALDIVPIFYKHLQKIKKQKKITLFLYSKGGRLDTPWPLVNLIREYCDELEIVVPHLALSAATLICLGADRIIMTPYSQLSPIDPIGVYNMGENKQDQIPIEDILGYIEFAKSKIGLAEQNSLTEVLNQLSQHIPPKILGSINRTHHLIRRLSLQMLKLHQDHHTEKQLKEITDHLTEKLYSHEHLINRKEAKNEIGFGDIIEYAKDDKLINDLMMHYKKILQLDDEFNPADFLGNKVEKDFSLTRAIIQSEQLSDQFVSKYKVMKLPGNSPLPNFNIHNFYNKWE